MSAPLSDAQGYELVRIATQWKLPVDLQKLIWADVTGRYHRRHGRWGQFGLSVIEKAHVVVQTAARRMLAIIKARLNGQSIGWRWSEFVGRRLDYARSVRLPKDMRRYGYDRRAPLQCRGYAGYDHSGYDRYMANHARDPAKYPVGPPPDSRGGHSYPTTLQDLIRLQYATRISALPPIP